MNFYKFYNKKLDCHYYHFERNDQNNAFGTVLRTLPNNDTGIFHILEHITLSGSKKYPVKDPFFKMMNRSLNTYQNAWTGLDFTFYPFSTANEKDFYNMMSVYLDCVYNSWISEHDFR